MELYIITTKAPHQEHERLNAIVFYNRAEALNYCIDNMKEYHWKILEINASELFNSSQIVIQKEQ